MTSRGDLLRVVGRIVQMVRSQYNKYRKDIASSKHSVKFKHMLESMPFLPPGIHDVLTTPAIERIREQDLLLQKEQRERRSGHPCSGLFEKTNGLPCRHTLRSLRNTGPMARLNFQYDDHWCYQRQRGQSIPLSTRPYQAVLEPLVAQTRGAPRRDGASTRRDPSAFERRVPPFRSQSQGQTLTEVLQHVNTSVTVSMPQPTPATTAVTTSVSLSIPAYTPAPVSSLIRSHSPPPPPPSVSVSIPEPVLLSSPVLSSPVSVTVSVTMALSPPPAVWQPPSLEEFLVDIERRRLQPVLDNCTDMNRLTDFLVGTGQEGDPTELVEARNMALATRGLYASCTPTMAWNYHFGDRDAFYAERFTQVNAQATLQSRDLPPRQRTKRAAAVAASNAWAGLSPRKRQRRQ
jgi:hypothetical protein